MGEKPGFVPEGEGINHELVRDEARQRLDRAIKKFDNVLQGFEQLRKKIDRIQRKKFIVEIYGNLENIGEKRRELADALAIPNEIVPNQEGLEASDREQACKYKFVKLLEELV